jgi:hypothetical protein
VAKMETPAFMPGRTSIDPSCKQHLRCRRLRLEPGGEVFTVAPAFVMPSMRGRTAEVDKALLLMRFHVPCWAIAHVFGRDAMYGYRLEQGLGRFSVVGTTVKSPERLPKDLDVRFISSLPVKRQPVCTAWVDTKPAQIVEAEG